MRKKKILILCLLLMSLGLGTALILLEKEEGKAQVKEKVSLIDEEKVESFLIENDHGTFHFIKQQITDTVPVWAVNGDLLLTEEGERILSIFKNFPLRRQIDASSLQDFGFDNPQTKVIFRFQEGEEKTIYFGNKTPTNDGYYMMIEGEKTIYIASDQVTPVVHFTDERKNQYVHVSFSSLEELVYQSQTYQFIIQRLAEKKDKDFSDFYFAEPFKTKPSLDISNQLMLDFLDFVNSHILIELPMDQNIDANELGFSNPTLDLYVRTTDGKEKRLLIGQAIDDSKYRYYAKVNNGNIIYELEVREPEKVFNLNPAKLAIQAPVYTFLNKTTEIELEFKGKQYKIQTYEDKEEYFLVNNQKFTDKQLIKDIYLSLLELKADTNVKEEVPSSDDDLFELIVKVAYADGEKTEVSFSEYNEIFYWIHQHGEKEFVIAKEKFEKLFAQLEELSKQIQ